MMDPVARIVDAWLQADRDQPVKQRHTAHRVWQRLVEEHEFTGAAADGTPLGSGTEDTVGLEPDRSPTWCRISDPEHAQ